MMTLILRLFLIVGLSALTLWGQARADVSTTGVQKDPRIEAELVAMSQWAAPGSTAILAIRQKISPEWHTYWRNPGDSGGPTEAVWSVPANFKVGEFIWPQPQRQSLMGLMSYVYSGEVYLPVPIEIPAGLKTGDRYQVSAQVLFLVCSDEMCVPVNMTLATDLVIGTGAAPLDAKHGRAIEALIQQAPRPTDIRASAYLDNGQLVLDAVDGPLKGAKPSWAYFYPYDQKTIDHAAAQKVQLGEAGLQFRITPGRGTRDGVSSPFMGVIATDLGAWEVTAEAGSALAGTQGKVLKTEADAVAKASIGGFAKAALFALLGGLILNLMPCVFPVLAMKAAALSRSAHEPGQLRKDGLAFTLGVLVSFAALAGLMLVLRALGQGVGWGFQLQSPAVVGGLALLMLAVAMNLSGLFDFGGRLQQLGAAGGQRQGVVGAFLTGVLAVVVAAPCTAPFMAVALGAALLMPWPMAIVVFLMLGLGLALPYLLLSLSPRLLKGLPKPGPWMERLRNLLALPMYGTALWLGWVYARQTGNVVVWLVAAAVLLAALLVLYGRLQSETARKKPLVLVVVILLVGTALATVLALRTPTAVSDGQVSKSALPSQAWSSAAVEAARAEGRPVFVNFTADWCVTCKINERTALSSERTAKLFADQGVVYLVGDWTRTDAKITAELERHGRSGVPLYLVYSPDKAEPEILPQVLTEGLVAKAVKTASTQP